ncbi:ABC transporter substrate-binding protein [Dactylosporangium sp. CA-233914]|uniref:ABC transporter substrate-binding protein n=1 Tax=Dactylosporangium sp. CA-233914 TaxID=3239934 RepID=UPI003D932611
MVSALVAGCTTTSSDEDGNKSNAPTDGTFTMAMAADPQSLDPQMTLDGTSLTMASFAYDALVSQKADGTFASQLASSWETKGKDWIFTLRKDLKCADGSTLTPQDVADNFSFMADPKNASPLNGTYLAAGVKAKADDRAGTVTLSVPADTQFFLNGLALVPIVCKKGIEDRKSLATTTNGTGPYKLESSASGDRYTYVRNEGYNWGPDGATNKEPGSPAKVIVRIVPSQSTTANLLLSGEVNAAAVSSADQKRLQAKRLYSAGYVSPLGEMFFNQGNDHVTSDDVVRKALTAALDLNQIRKVYTSGNGEAPRTFTPGNPPACAGDSITSALPSTSVEEAKSILEQAGWTVGSDGIRTKNGRKLTVSFLYLTDLIPGAASASELAAEAWKQIGVDVKPNGVAVNQSNEILFGTGAWDVAWTGLGVAAPNQLVSVFQGAAPPDGSNFAHLANSTYDSEVKLAQASNDNNGCEHWLKAETALVKDADVVPFAAVEYLTYGSRAQFGFVAGQFVPTSVRLKG